MPMRTFSAGVTYLLSSAPAIAVGVVASTAAGCGSNGNNSGSGPGLDGSTTQDGAGGQDSVNTQPGSDGASTQDGSAEAAVTDGGDAGAGCIRMPAAADRPRFAVVSHPFGADGGASTQYEVLSLSQTGTLTRPSMPVTFSLGGSADFAPIVFTPDGAYGFVVQDNDGSIGVFHLDASGTPTVVNPGYAGTFYASALVVSADGAHLYVLDSDTAANKGGVYQLAIGCDGTLSNEKLAIPGGTAYVMALLPTNPTDAVLSAGAAFNSPPTADTELVDLSALSLLSSTEGFFQEAGSFPTPSSIAVTPDGKYALVTDDGDSVGDRIAVVAIQSSMLSSVATLSSPTPAFVVTSPFDNAAIVLNPIGSVADQINVLSYDPNKPSAPFTITGQLTYQFPAPQLPATAGLISQGSLKGTVLISENTAVRQVAFTATGQVTDTAYLLFKGGDESIVGVIGVQP